jgi:hypothetical protein
MRDRQARQDRYKKTKKGRKAQSEAQIRYLARRISWQALLTPEWDERLNAAKVKSGHERISRAKFLTSVVIPAFLENFPEPP